MAAGTARLCSPKTELPARGTEDLPVDDDLTLVWAAQEDQAAFAPLYHRYARQVYRYCYRRLGNHDAAEDATSQIFLKAIAGLRGFSSGSFRAWLFTIADRVVTDIYRRRRPSLDLAAAADLADNTPGPEDIAITADTRRSVQSLLSQLPAEQRRIVELRLAGLTGPEIAAVLGRRPEAVKSMQFRAYARLRRLLRAGAPGESTDVDR